MKLWTRRKAVVPITPALQHSSTPPSARAGFTLLEVMLAVAIVGTALFGLALAISQCMGAAKQTGNYTTAYDLLDGKFMEFSNETNFVVGTVSGTFDGDFSNFQWQREVVQDESQLDSLFRQTIIVSWRDRGSMKDLSVMSMIYNPNSGDAAGPGGLKPNP